MAPHSTPVITDVSVERRASIIMVTRVGELGTLAVTDSCHTDDGAARYLRNVGSYKSHAAQHSRRRHSSTQELSGQLCVAVMYYRVHTWISGPCIRDKWTESVFIRSASLISFQYNTAIYRKVSQICLHFDNKIIIIL
jgi:hypothetical protein